MASHTRDDDHSPLQLQSQEEAAQPTPKVGLLPPPAAAESEAGATHVDISTGEALKFDALGPMVVNSDGVRGF